MAASYSSYGTQYLRRMLQTGKLEGTKIGQLWLVEKGAADRSSFFIFRISVYKWKRYLFMFVYISQERSKPWAY